MALNQADDRTDNPLPDDTIEDAAPVEVTPLADKTVQRHVAVARAGSSDLAPLARWAGGLLVVATLCAVAAVMAFGSVGRESAWGWIFIGVGLLALAGWFLGRRQNDGGAAHIGRDSYARQRALLGTNAITSVLLFLVLLVGLNYIATRRHKVFDLTSNRVNSLSDQTAKALQQLPGPITLTAVFAPHDKTGQPDPNITALLNAYKNASDKVHIDYLDAAADPARLAGLQLGTSTQQLDSGQPLILAELENKNSKATPPSAVAAHKGRQEITVADEQNVTTALLRLINPRPRSVYFLMGHGEATPDSQSVDLSGAAAALAAQNIVVKTTSLATTRGVPRDAGALIVVGPQVDLTPAEQKTLSAYMADKGRLVLLLGATRTPLPHWKALAQSLGVAVLDGFVFDRESPQPQYVRAAVGDPTRQELLRGVSGDVIFPAALPLSVFKLPTNVRVPPGAPTPPVALFASSPQSQIVLPGQRPSGKFGSYVLAAAVERGAAGSPGAQLDPTDAMRAVVVGDSYFVTGQFFTLLGNGSFFTAAVNWVVGADKNIAIPPKPPITNTINLTPEAGRFIILFSLLTLPLLTLLIGGVVWWQRR